LPFDDIPIDWLVAVQELCIGKHDVATVCARAFAMATVDLHEWPSVRQRTSSVL
jgi:hypothetical protein